MSAGCSTLDLSLWPANFPLLKQTKEIAAKSPRPAGLPHELAKQALPEYYVEPGDHILIETTKTSSDFPAIGDQKIQVDGSIDLGRFGRLRVAGMTVEAIEASIEDRILEVDNKTEPINVQLVEPNAAVVYVLGEVGSPGAYPIDGNETVLDAIVAAGGLTSRASPCDIIFVRPTAPDQCRVVLPVCYRQLTQIGDVTTNYQVQPGDRIVVAPRTFMEELTFWKQTSPCPLCACKRECVECNPSSVSYSNRFMEMLTQFPLPRKFSGSNSKAGDESNQLPSRGRNEAPGNPGERQPANNNNRSPIPPADPDRVFLPPINSSQIIHKPIMRN
jgi:protein involved in polysaccharide export with SLBB domain